ncbi:MAG TPA: FAD-dependent oxidoreductase, partial [Flavobacterium sp.]|nr:FAD-dependent oxidoreductase [Flavobacterium sp.]
AKIKIADNTYEYRFAKNGQSFDFIPGQYVGLSFTKLIKPDPAGNIKCFSLTSVPSDPHIGIVLRQSDSGLKTTLDSLKLGEPAIIEGPYGQFTLHADQNKPAVFIVGGIGIAPVLSIINDLLAKNVNRDITIFFSNKNRAVAPYFEYFQKLTTHPSFKLIFNLTEPESDWAGISGRLNQEMLQKYVPDIHVPVYYLVGKPDMVYQIYELLESLGIPDENIKTESFAGY